MILGNLIIKTSWDVMEFPLKVHLTRMKTWLYLWRSATGHLLTFFLCDKHPMEMCLCNSHRKSSCHSFTKKARNSKEYMDAFKLFTKTLKEILNGLIYLHEIGCAHRGLKLSNVLVCIYFSSTVKTHISN